MLNPKPKGFNQCSARFLRLIFGKQTIEDRGACAERSRSVSRDDNHLIAQGYGEGRQHKNSCHCEEKRRGNLPCFSDVRLVTPKANFLLVALCMGSVASALFGQTIPRSTPGLEDSLLSVLASGATYKEKATACRQLGTVGTGKAVPVLGALLADEKLSHMARYALETIPDPAVEKVLRDGLSMPDCRSR